jgi:DMSO reductase anchor subunit
VKLEIEFIPQLKQTVWKRKAALNFILGGAGAGAYLSHALISLLITEEFGGRLIVATEWLSVLLMGAGLVSVALEAGKPWRAAYVLNRLHSSWMSREALMAAVFMFLCILQSQWPHAVFKSLCAASAAGFMAAQGFILHASRAIPAWNSTALPPLLIVSSLYAGCGLNLINHSVSGAVPDMLLLATLLAGIADGAFWHFYWGSVRPIQPAPAGGRASQKWRSGRELMFGHLLPLGLVGLSLPASGSSEAGILPMFLAAIAGLGVFLSSSLRKWRILGIGRHRAIGIDF